MYTEIEQYTPIGKAIETMAQEMKLPFQATGGSGRGWSYWATLQQCPYKFHRRYNLGLEGAESQSRAVGSLVHFMLACHYHRHDLVDTQRITEMATALKCAPAVVAEASRLMNHYVLHYDNDYLEPLAVEHTVPATPENNYSCRYDLIARVKEVPGDIYAPAGGVYIVEHKTAHSFTNDALNGWGLDGEILGQLALWRDRDLSTTFGPLQGLIVNIIGKQKVPQFARTIINPDWSLVDQHVTTLTHLVGTVGYHNADNWPKYTNACIGRYGRCENYDHCLSGGSNG